MPHSRTGATTWRSGARAAVATSKRTWSLPLPVQPCATAWAPSRRATSTIIAAISGRPNAVASGYSFSYTAPACSEGHTNSWRNGILPSATYAAEAPVFRARAWIASRSFFSPRSTVNAITSHPWSLSHRLATDVSNPPEYATTSFSVGIDEQLPQGAACGGLAQPGEERVVSRDPACDAAEARLVDSARRHVRPAPGGPCDRDSPRLL